MPSSPLGCRRATTVSLIVDGGPLAANPVRARLTGRTQPVVNELVTPERSLPTSRASRGDRSCSRDRGDRPADDARRDRVGDRAAVPGGVLLPGRQGRLGLARPAAAARRARRPALLPRRRARAGRRPRAASAEMLPRAEIAHWLFAAGFLLLALVLLAEAIVGSGCSGAVPGARTSGRPAALRRRVALAGRDLLDLLDAPPARARGLGSGRDRCRRGAAGGRPRPPRLAHWSLVPRSGSFVSGASFLVHEQNGWLFSRSAFLHHVIGWTMLIAAVFPLGAALRPRGRLGVRLRGDLDRRRGDAVRRPRRRPDLRASLGPRRRGAVRRALVAVARGARASGAAVAHATLKRAMPAEQCCVERPPTEIVLRFDQSVTAPPARSWCSPRTGEGLGRRDAADAEPDPCRGWAGSARARPTPSAGASSPPTGTSAPGSSRSASASKRRRHRSGRRVRTDLADDVARWGFRRTRAAARRVGIRLFVLPRASSRGSTPVYMLGTLGACRLERRDRRFVMRCERAPGVRYRPALRRPVAVRRVDALRDAFLATTLGFACLTPRRRVGARPPSALAGVPARRRAREGRPLGTSGDRAERIAPGQFADWVHLVAAMMWVGGF